MGYIPMKPNDIALQYGSRMPSVHPLIRANVPVQAVPAKDKSRKMQRDRPAPLGIIHPGPRKVREVEAYVSGKGQRFDALA